MGAAAFAAACGGGSAAPTATPSATQPPLVTPTPTFGPQPITTPAARTPARVERDVAYVVGGSAAQKLDLYFSTANLRPAPLAVYIHGGGVFAGDKGAIAAPASIFSVYLGELLSRGYTVASLNYRLSPEAPFPAAVEDCKAAIRFLRANAARYGFFAGRIGAFGGSAGGNLAAMLGVTTPADGLEGSGGNPNFPSRVQAVADLFGPSDFSLPIVGGEEGEKVEVYFGSGDVEATKRRAGPITYVSSDDPPPSSSCTASATRWCPSSTPRGSTSA